MSRARRGSDFLPMIAAFLLALTACEETIDPKAAQSAKPADPAIDLRAASNAVAFRRHEVARRLHAEPVAPVKLREHECPDDRLERLGLEPTAKLLVLRTY